MRRRSVFVTEEAFGKREKHSHHYIQRYIAMPGSDSNSPLTQFASSCHPPPGKRLRYAFPTDPGPSFWHQRTNEENKAKDDNNNNQQGAGL